MTRYPLQDKVVLITGASGGIGAATARALATRGARLVLTDLDELAVKQLGETFVGDRVLARQLDVTDADATVHVVDEAVATFGQLDVVFANAGIGPDRTLTIAAMARSQFETIVEVDLLGVYRTIRAALPHVVRAQGQVVTTGSIYSYANGVGNAPYAAAKAGVEQITRALRAELAGTGATATIVCPGWIRTQLTETLYGGDDLTTRIAARAFRGPLRRRVEPDVVAAAVVDGIERRARRVDVPAPWGSVALLRGFVNVATDVLLDRDMTIHRMLRASEARELDR